MPVHLSENLTTQVVSLILTIQDPLVLDEDNDSEFKEILTKPHLKTQRGLNDFVRDLNLIKKNSKLLGPRLKR